MRTVLITGASRGLGKQAALDFLQAGYNVVANYNNTHISEEDFLEYPDHILCIKADVRDYDQVSQMVARSQETFGHIDVVINNAAVSCQGLLTDMESEQWETIIDINLKGVFNVCKCVIPDMVKNKKGRIINISSIWGIAGASCEVAYSASKAGIIGFTKALAKELAPSNIYVNCIAPGIIETDMNKDFSKDMLIEMIPLGRMGTLSDITDMIIFLAEEKTSFITGQVFSVNGGTVI